MSVERQCNSNYVWDVKRIRSWLIYKPNKESKKTTWKHCKWSTNTYTGTERLAVTLSVLTRGHFYKCVVNSDPKYLKIIYSTNWAWTLQNCRKLHYLNSNERKILRRSCDYCWLKVAHTFLNLNCRAPKIRKGVKNITLNSIVHNTKIHFSIYIYDTEIYMYLMIFVD